MGSESQRWSCGTLQDGVQLMDLALEEQELLRQIQATILTKNGSVSSNSPSDRLWMMKSGRSKTLEIPSKPEPEQPKTNPEGYPCN